MGGGTTTGGMATTGGGTSTTGTGTTGGGSTSTSSTTGSSVSAGNPNVMQVDVFIIAQYSTCIIGDPCPGSGCATSVVTAQKFAQSNNLLIVAPSDPRVNTAAQAVCISPAMSQTDQNALVGLLDTNFVTTLNGDTGSTLELKFVFHTLTYTMPQGLGMAPLAGTPAMKWTMSASDVNDLVL